MRPHSLTVPKPMFPIAGKPIVQRLVEDLIQMVDEPIDEIAYVIAPDFGEAIEQKLKSFTQNLKHQGDQPPKASIYYQEEALGTAHAILCAQEALSGPVLMGFADTLFKADFEIDLEQDGVIYTHEVDDPSAFGVVKVDHNNNIVDFVEKPEEPISNLAIVGIYYIKDGDTLKNELQYLIDNDIKDKGEYQLTNALENMKTKGVEFVPGKVEEWYDCGNKEVTVQTNKNILQQLESDQLIADSAQIENSVITEPCFIGPNCKIKDAVIGPYVSVEANTEVKRSIIRESILQEEVKLQEVNLQNSIIGNYVEYTATPEDLSIGDYSTIDK